MTSNIQVLAPNERRDSKFSKRKNWNKILHILKFTENPSVEPKVIRAYEKHIHFSALAVGSLPITLPKNGRKLTNWERLQLIKRCRFRVAALKW